MDKKVINILIVIVIVGFLLLVNVVALLSSGASQSPTRTTEIKQCNRERINQHIGGFEFKPGLNTSTFRSAILIPFEQTYSTARVVDAGFKGICSFGDPANGTGNCSFSVNGISCGNFNPINQNFVIFYNFGQECIDAFEGGINDLDVTVTPYGNLTIQNLVFEIEFIPGNC